MNSKQNIKSHLAFWGVVYGSAAGILSVWFYIIIWVLAAVFNDPNWGWSLDDISELIFVIFTIYLMFGIGIGLPIGLFSAVIGVLIVERNNRYHSASKVGASIGCIVGLTIAPLLMLTFQEGVIGYMPIFSAICGGCGGYIAGKSLYRRYLTSMVTPTQNTKNIGGKS